jgi:predicted tellurium resistance membrane protein TerC
VALAPPDGEDMSFRDSAAYVLIAGVALGLVMRLIQGRAVWSLSTIWECLFWVAGLALVIWLHERLERRKAERA